MLRRVDLILLLRVPLLLGACSGGPPLDDVRCERVEGGLAGEIVELDGSTRAAFDCSGYWRCDDEWGALVYDVRDALDEEPLEDVDVWCARCRWAGEPVPAAALAAPWSDLVAACAW